MEKSGAATFHCFQAFIPLGQAKTRRSVTDGGFTQPPSDHRMHREIQNGSIGFEQTTTIKRLSETDVTSG